MAVGLEMRAVFRSPFRRIRRGAARSGAASSVWAPAGSHTVSSSPTGHRFPSIRTPPFHGTPTPAADSTSVFPPDTSTLLTAAAADGSSFRSGS